MHVCSWLDLIKRDGHCYIMHTGSNAVPTPLVHNAPYIFSSLIWKYKTLPRPHLYLLLTTPIIMIVDLYVHLHTLGAQLREWLLYFSLPVLKGIFPAQQLDHYCYLVAGVHIVLSYSISDADLSCADRCFHQFYSQFTSIYGNNYGECEAALILLMLVCP